MQRRCCRAPRTLRSAGGAAALNRIDQIPESHFLLERELDNARATSRRTDVIAEIDREDLAGKLRVAGRTLQVQQRTRDLTATMDGLAAGVVRDAVWVGEPAGRAILAGDERELRQFVTGDAMFERTLSPSVRGWPKRIGRSSENERLRPCRCPGLKPGAGKGGVLPSGKPGFAGLGDGRNPQGSWNEPSPAKRGLQLVLRFLPRASARGSPGAVVNNADGGTPSVHRVLAAHGRRAAGGGEGMVKGVEETAQQLFTPLPVGGSAQLAITRMSEHVFGDGLEVDDLSVEIEQQAAALVDVVPVEVHRTTSRRGRAVLEVAGWTPKAWPGAHEWRTSLIDRDPL